MSALAFRKDSAINEPLEEQEEEYEEDERGDISPDFAKQDVKSQSTKKSLSIVQS